MDAQAPLVAPTHHVWASAELAAAVRDDQPGAVIRLARRAAGLRLDQLGRLYGCSGSTLSRIERGLPPADQVEVRRRLAHLLGIPDEYVGLTRHAAASPQSTGQTDTLRTDGGDPMRRRTILTGASAAAVAGLAGAQPAGAAPAADGGPGLERLLLAPTAQAAPLTAKQATADVAAAGRAYREARYRTVTAALPGLLSGLHATAANSSGPARDATAVLLSRAYQLASATATKFGDDAIALAMADRARTEALASGDRLTLTAATHSLAITMRRDGHHTAALNLLTGTAAQLDLRDLDPAVLAAYGGLLCTAAYTSAQSGDRGAADTYIREAEAAATRVHDRDDASAAVIPFSSASVAVYRIGVYTALGETGIALAAAATVNPALLRTRERHGRYLVDTARAWARHGRPAEAANAVLAAHRHAPEEVDRASVRDLVTTLLYSPTPTPAALRGLAARLGVR